MLGQANICIGTGILGMFEDVYQKGHDNAKFTGFDLITHDQWSSLGVGAPVRCDASGKNLSLPYNVVCPTKNFTKCNAIIEPETVRLFLRRWLHVGPFFCCRWACLAQCMRACSIECK